MVKSHWHQEGGDDDEHFTVVLKPERKILVRGGVILKYILKEQYMIVCTGYDGMIWNGGPDVMWTKCDDMEWRTGCDVD